MIYIALISSAVAIAAIMVACALLSDRARRMHDEAFWRDRDPNFPADAPAKNSNAVTGRSDPVSTPQNIPQGQPPNNKASRTSAGYLFINGSLWRVK